MKHLKIGLLALAFISQLSFAKLSVKTHVAGEAGFLVTSHLVEGTTDAILIDAQFTRSEAKKVADLVKKSKKNLKAIYITHGHPDHYFGLEVLTKEFPKAEVVASKEVIDEIKATAQGKIDYWKKIYKDDLTDTFVTPSVLDESKLTLDGEKLVIRTLAEGGESEHPTVVYIPSIETLIAGDLLYNNVHLWLAENRPEGWLKNLEEAKTVGKISNVLPGHGEPGGVELFKTNATYIQDFQGATGKGATRQAAIATMLKKYPKYRLAIILETSVGTRLAE